MSATKKEVQESLLTPRFYTTDFEEMDQLFNTEINKNLNEEELIALLQEFKTDYNQTHFVRNKEFEEAADQIFVEFCEWDPGWTWFVKAQENGLGRIHCRGKVLMSGGLWKRQSKSAKNHRNATLVTESLIKEMELISQHLSSLESD